MNQRKPRLKPRVAPVPPDYLAEMRRLDEQRRVAGLSHLAFEERARIAVGSWPKYLNPDARHGRIASAATLAKVRAALACFAAYREQL